MSGRAFFIPSVVLCSILLSSCGDPPVNEMQQAQGAIDAARAAGADQYARDELQAAQQSLRNAEQAVAAHDYRLALNNALDSRERAQNAAKQAANGRAAVADQAVRTLTEADQTLDAARAALRAAERAGIAGSAQSRVRRAMTATNTAVQKARAAFSQGDYPGVTAALAKPLADLRAATENLQRPGSAAGRARP